MNERKIIGYICLAPIALSIIFIIQRFPMYSLIAFLLIVVTAVGIHFITTADETEECNADFEDNSKQ